MRKSTLATLTGAMALGIGLTFASANTPASDVSTETALSRNLVTFNSIARQLAEHYVDSMRPDAAVQAAIAAMLNTVDPYTEYYNSDDKEQLEIMTTGAYGGIGAFVMGRDGNTYISLPIEGSPSYKAGLKSGDKILRVDTTDVQGRPTDFTTKLLRGEPGTTVLVTVERPYATDSILQIEVLRERVQDKSVPFAGVIGGDVGYVKLTSFMEKSPKEVQTALESFKEVEGLKGVVLDLRDNGGGLVESAVDILGMFLPRGSKVLETKGKTENQNTTYTTSKHPVMPDTPLVILIDDGSASASEIVAGAVQDLDRGVLVGQRSFGKGLVQSTLQTPFSGLLKITTAKYYLPSGRLIQALDYTHRKPDGSVARTPDSLTNEFKTKKGRIVRDGGGLVPDTVTALPDYSRLLFNLVSANQIFDYATKYAAEHPSIPAPSEFKVTDEIYEDFIAFVDTAKIKSDKTGRQLLDELRKTANTEGFMTEALRAELDTLETLIQPDLSRDLRNRRQEVSEFLGREIVSRYYNRSGEDEFSLAYDTEFAVAADMLRNKELYDAMLAAPGQTKGASADKKKPSQKKKTGAGKR